MWKKIPASICLTIIPFQQLFVSSMNYIILTQGTLHSSMKHNIISNVNKIPATWHEQHNITNTETKPNGTLLKNPKLSHEKYHTSNFQNQLTSSLPWRVATESKTNKTPTMSVRVRSTVRVNQEWEWCQENDEKNEDDEMKHRED